ncbi:unnamed protein product [Bursaphelenchus xylophilus]|uniref:(pine wood nematode) hypothetical protein n=1 Tax=Bursaphelenchus xylophilus TaxID=6326 RepID=A0A1I7RV76_BURXY|nr:unnamed protein product [Bursaphelenchus xylophilus]CAG9124682.1 unnamed protein product [Bursaphelenchus xylophilus]
MTSVACFFNLRCAHALLTFATRVQGVDCIKVEGRGLESSNPVSQIGSAFTDTIMHLHLIFVAFAVIPCTMAFFGGRGGPGGPPHGPPGPLGEIFAQLTEQQKQQVHQILADTRELTKGQQKAAIDNFVSTLSSDLQAKVKEGKSRFEQMIAQQDQKAQSLSQNAQNLYSQITAVLKDDSITRPEEHQKIQAIVQNADKSVLDEFRNAGIRLPLGPPHGPGGPHGGPFGRHGGPGPMGPLSEIFKDLTQEQREQVRKIFEKTRDATKAQQKAAIDNFVSTLSSELQQKVQEGKAKFEKKIAEDDEKVKSLSQSAQDFYSKVKAVLRDDSITRPEEHEKIHTIVESVGKSVLDELRKAEIRLPLGPPPPPPHGPHGGPRGPYGGPWGHQRGR